jgi:vacuolar-type H+-ATPase subunit H
MIEYFFRSLKSNYLNSQKIRDKKDIIRKITFYVNQYNTKIPKAVLKGATPLEAFEQRWSQCDQDQLKEKRKQALKKRRSIPPLPTCNICS